MDRMSLVIGNDTKQNHFTTLYPKGAKEILYQVAFENAFKYLLRNFPVKIVQQKTSNNQRKKCDTVIGISEEHLILVEDCANVAVSGDRTDVNTLAHHIKQAKD